MNTERYVGDSKLHEMVEIAMEESWDVCVAHMERVTGTIGAVIARRRGVRRVRGADVPLAAMCTCTAMMRFFHPQMIAQCVDKPGPVARPDDRFCAGGPDAAIRIVFAMTANWDPSLRVQRSNSSRRWN